MSRLLTAENREPRLRGNTMTTAAHKVIPVMLLAFYALCSICPGRLLPASAMQKDEANEAHDCDQRKQKSDSDCRTAIIESLPPSAEKFVVVLSSHASLPPVIFAPAFEFF